MRRFTALFRALDATTKTERKLAALRAYFREALPEDAAWALHFLEGGKLSSRIATTTELRAWTAEELGIPPWLVEDSFASVGDLGETLALLWPEPSPAPFSPFASVPLSRLVQDHLVPLAGLAAETRRAGLVALWRGLGLHERFLVNKILTGAFRVGAARRS